MNMDHMGYVDDVVAKDVAHLREKERTYQGSWKRRGGVGAFMMLARKWDRLESMLSGDPWNYDVFRAVEAQPVGVDGSVLAEVRDLRRYLVLVEAEMTARGVVGVARSKEPGCLPKTRRSKQKPDADESRHASLAPWIVHEQPHESVAMAYRKLSPDTWALEAYFRGRLPLSSISGMYETLDDLSIIKIGECPPDARDYFPTLRDGINSWELSQLPAWQRKLYNYESSGRKHNLIERAWLSETE